MAKKKGSKKSQASAQEDLPATDPPPTKVRKTSETPDFNPYSIYERDTESEREPTNPKFRSQTSSDRQLPKSMPLLSE
ncbi:hypothetical protein N7540_010051 [Penicillium herquei]|nr:hypothetical protein N7540_010051 [Penicillium herquei]